MAVDARPTVGAGHPSIAVLGGTGKEGSGLARRWANAGYPVILGSRSTEKAAAAAATLNALLSGRSDVVGMDNFAAASAGSVVVLAVPFEAQRTTALGVRQALQGKILIDVTVPLFPPSITEVHLPQGGSAVAQLQRELGAGVRVVSAFQNVSAVQLRDPLNAVDCDVLVCGDDAEAREQVISLARAAGMVAWHAGTLANSVAAEALTSVLIAINRTYRIPNAGVRISGVPRPAGDVQSGLP